MNASLSCVTGFVQRLSFLDNVGHLFSRITDVASSALNIAQDITVRQAAKEASFSGGVVHVGSTRESTQQKIRHASTVLSYSSVSLNLVRLFCEAFTLPMAWYKASTDRANQGIGFAEALVTTSFVAQRALAVTQYFGVNQAVTPSLGYAAHGILGFGIVGNLVITYYKFMYVETESIERRFLEVIRNTWDLICWLVDTVRYSLQNATLNLVSAALGLIDAVVWVSSIMLYDSFEEGSKPVITL